MKSENVSWQLERAVVPILLEKALWKTKTNLRKAETNEMGQLVLKSNQLHSCSSYYLVLWSNKFTFCLRLVQVGFLASGEIHITTERQDAAIPGKALEPDTHSISARIFSLHCYPCNSLSHPPYHLQQHPQRQVVQSMRTPKYYIQGSLYQS